MELSLGAPTNSNNAHKVDIKIELFKNGTEETNKILEGILLKQQVVGNEQNSLSKNYKIPLPLLTNVDFAAEDYLYCRVWVRKSDGSSDFPIRMWYNGSPDPNSDQGNKAWSRIYKVTIGGNTQNYYYFRGGLTDGYYLLSTSSGTSATSNSLTATTSYQLFGTWRIVGSNMKRSTSSLPIELMLGQNYPNPFNPSTIITYSIPAYGHVTLTVYDMYSRKLATLVDQQQQQGIYQVEFDADGLACGTYMYRLEAKGMVLQRFMALVK